MLYEVITVMERFFDLFLLRYDFPIWDPPKIAHAKPTNTSGASKTK